MRAISQLRTPPKLAPVLGIVVVLCKAGNARGERGVARSEAPRCGDSALQKRASKR